MDLFIRRSLQATYNNLFYRIHFYSFYSPLPFALVFLFFSFLFFWSFAELRWTQQYRSQR